jgi:hypothetical protein
MYDPLTFAGERVPRTVHPLTPRVPGLLYLVRYPEVEKDEKGKQTHQSSKKPFSSRVGIFEDRIRDHAPRRPPQWDPASGHNIAAEMHQVPEEHGDGEHRPEPNVEIGKSKNRTKCARKYRVPQPPRRCASPGQQTERTDHTSTGHNKWDNTREH